MTPSGTRIPRTFCLILILSALLWSLAMPAQFKSEAAPARESATNPSKAPTQEEVGEAYGKMKLQFEANRGQTNAAVQFLTHGPGYNLFLTANEAVFLLQEPGSPPVETSRRRNAAIDEIKDPRPKTQDQKPSRAVALRMRLVGANPQAQVSGLEELPGKVNYFIGSDSKKWQTEVPTYERVRYNHIYPGIDLDYYGAAERGIEDDFVVEPGVDSRVIQMEFSGADRVEVNAAGDLVIHTEVGALTQSKPVAYQKEEGMRRPVESRYVAQENGRIGFAVGDYDRDKPLIIDPVVNLSQLAFSTLLGGTGFDRGNGIAVDATGNVYVTGLTASPLYPSTTGAFDMTYNGNYDVFVTKLNASGTALVYSTFIGGSLGDQVSGIIVDATGNAYVTGFTFDAVTDYPTTPGAFDPTHNGSYDVFVTKLNASGTALVYSTFIGGSGFDGGNGIALDAVGNAYVTGETTDDVTDYPTTVGAFDTTHNGDSDVFVTKLNASGTALVYSTFIGGSGLDRGNGVALDVAGNAYVTGDTTDAVTNYPTTVGAFDTTHNGYSDVFVTKLNASGTALVYSTFIGGTGDEQGKGIAVDTVGSAYITGSTFDDATDYPTTPNAIEGFHNGGSDVFVTKLNASGTALVYSTFIGGSSLDGGNGISVDTVGNAYITGNTVDAENPIFPITMGAFDTTPNGDFDVFVSKLNPEGSILIYSTFIGGSSEDNGNGIAVDVAGNAYVTGSTFLGFDYPTTPNAIQPFPGGGFDAFVSKFGDFSIAGRTISSTGVPIAGTLVSMSGPISGNVMTDSEGYFGFTDTVNGENFSVAATRGATVFNPALFNVSNLTGNRELVFVGVANAPTGFPGGQLRINGPNYTVSENGTSVTLTVERIAIISADTVTVNYSTANGSALSGTDYQQTQGTLIFNPLEPIKTITIPISNDSQLEPLESFSVSLSNPSGGAVLLPQSTALVAIKDDDISSGNLLISEFRTRGPQGPSDEFVELYNNTDVDLTVNAPDGSAGWTLAALSSNGQSVTPRFTLPTGLTIPARGHYLGANTSSGGYSLPDYPTGTGLRSIGDATFSTDIADNTGLVLMRTANPANFNAPNVLDAVGFGGPDGLAADLCREGGGMKPIGLANIEQSFVRRMTGDLVQDTNSNAQDFVLLSSTAGQLDGTSSALGAPGPQNMSSLVDRYHALFQMTTLDSVYDPTVVANGALGTISIQQRMTNTTGVPIGRLRLRITEITTLGTNQRVPGRPDVRALSSQDMTMTLPSSKTVALRGVTVEEVPLQPYGGGLNSSLRVNGITEATPILPGETIYVHLLLGVQRWGRYRFQVIVEAMP